MTQKRLLLLGGSRYLRPVIKEAHKLGIYVITCDYLPDNYAHKISNEYVNVSLLIISLYVTRLSEYVGTT